MNILFLEGDMSRCGGTERMTAWLANKFCIDNSISVLSLNFEKQEVFYPLSDNISHIVLPSGNILKKILRIRKILRQLDIDVVINVDTGMGYIGILAALGTRCKTVTWEHSNFYNNWNSKIFPYLRKFAVKHSDKFVVLTELDKSNYSSNIKCKDITVIPNPANKQEPLYDISSKCILSAGLVNKIKRFDLIIPTAEKIFSKYPDWHWEICGDGPELSKIKQSAENSPVKDNLIFCGSVKDMDAHYKNAAMYVLTSEMEGLPMVLLEAKSHGLPIVSFDINTGPSDIITDSVNGFLVPSGDIDTLASKICTLIESDKLRIAFSENSQKDIDNFSTETIIKKWETLLLNTVK